MEPKRLTEDEIRAILYRKSDSWTAEDRAKLKSPEAMEYMLGQMEENQKFVRAFNRK